MVIYCYMLIKTRHGQNRIVAKKLEKIEEIIDLNEIYGRYDIIAKIGTDTIEDLQKVRQNKIAIIEGIIHTETLIVSNSHEFKPEASDDDFDEGFENNF